MLDALMDAGGERHLILLPQIFVKKRRHKEIDRILITKIKITKISFFYPEYSKGILT
jgi:hypothetical protein